MEQTKDREEFKLWLGTLDILGVDCNRSVLLPMEMKIRQWFLFWFICILKSRKYIVTYNFLHTFFNDAL